MFKPYLASLLACILWALPLSAQAGDFPLPQSLEPAVNFWQKIYSEIDNNQGYLHDDRNFRIYKTISIPAKASRKTRKRQINRHRDQLKKLIRRIADKSANDLKGEERRIRELFPANATAREIRAGLRHIRFQRGQADKFHTAIERSGLYWDYIRNVLRQKGLPLELATLPFVESSFNIRANSHVGASGIWQFMPATGRRFMKVNHVIDERYDPFRATHAAAELLAYNYSILGSWPLALTAYNHGVGGMRRAVRKTGSRDIGVIVERYRSRSFGFASRNFYAEFLAALEVSSNPDRYFPGATPRKAEPYAKFTLDAYVPAKVLADSLGISMKELRRHNLALREPIWDGDKHLPKDYQLRIPQSVINEDIDRLLAKIPAAERHKEQIPDVTYKVRRGDSLSRIAGIYGIKVSDLVAMNNLRSQHRIRIGQTLFLPQKGKRVAAVTKPKQSIKVAAVAQSAKTKPESLTEVISKDVAIVEEIAPEQVSKILVDEEEKVGLQQIAATDPGEYRVAKDNTIEAQAAETLGHYADWLAVSSSKLRKMNRMSSREKLIIGKPVLLDFSQVSTREFEAKRSDYHKQLEDEFFAQRRISSTREYRVRKGDSLWHISNRRTSAPLWLIRQHNPDVDFGRLKPGDRIVLPVIEKKEVSS